MVASGRIWTCAMITGVAAMAAAVICLTGYAAVRGGLGHFGKKQAIIEMVVEGCVSPDVYPPPFDKAFQLHKSGRDTWFRIDGKFLVYRSLPVSERNEEEEDPRVRRVVISPGKQVVISEILASYSHSKDEDGEASDWVELHNREEMSINLEGWSLTDHLSKPKKWIFPSYIMEPGQYLVVYASGKDRLSGKYLHTNFQLKEKGEYIALIRPDGSVATTLDHIYPQQIPHVTYGIPDYPSDTSHFTYLDEPTPGKPNVGVLDKGPFISEVKLRSKVDMPPAGEDLVIDAVISPYSATPECVSLVYTVMYGTEVHFPMSTTGQSGYTASIPATAFTAGNMVRWYVKATDKKGRTVREPPFPKADWPQYQGTVIVNSSLTSSLPPLHWFTKDPKSAVKDGARGSVFFNGKFYDNVFTRGRGQSTHNWRKHKIKFDFKGAKFEYKNNRHVEEFNLQSFYTEKGEVSYMREPVAFRILNDAGVPASDSMYMTVNQNGEYYGLFAFIEQVDYSFLERRGYSTDGPLFKAIDWDKSNLRWDVKQKQMRFFYRKANRKNIDDWKLLKDLTMSLSGGGSMPRSKYIFDRLNLPEIINYMAVNSMILNQDRCTKNYYLYLNPKDLRWTIFPWDMEGGFGISHLLGEPPAQAYCLLVCEQFNSPLFCDSEHSQDTDLASTARRMLQPNISTGPTYRIPSPEEYDKDQTRRPSLEGIAGHFNYLYDALLDWPVTREMYLRRLRSLTDEYMNGSVQYTFESLWGRIRSEALRDSAKWSITSNPDNGLKQLLTKVIPTRRAQLLEIYGPEGSGLVPCPQPAAPPMNIKDATNEYVEIENNNSFAVDMSNWVIGGDTYFKCPPGTVVASHNSLFITPDINAFYKRRKSPMVGEGLFVLGPSLPISGSSFVVYTDQSIQVKMF